MQRLLCCLTYGIYFSVCFAANAGEPVGLVTFHVDATPPLGSPVAYAKALNVTEPLSARGIVLLSDEAPIVLCAVDWIGIGNGGNDAWRDALAEAAGTTRERVAVHTLHQHDAPRCDFTAEELLEEQGLGGQLFSPEFARETISRTADAVRASLNSPATVTHLGVGRAKVERVASNRRILGDDGKVKIIRWSKSRNPEAIAAPEGVIDPYVPMLTFWHDNHLLASLTYYATHPQSYYGRGDVSPDFVGIARTLHEAETPQALHVHFNGAGGNIAAGKYNDGSPENRPELAKRLAAGMHAAWLNTVRIPIQRSDIEWRTRSVNLPLAEHLNEEQLSSVLQNEEAPTRERLYTALKLAWLQRNQAGRVIDLTCLRIANAYVLHMPGELFVEYQLAAQDMRPTEYVCMAAYGDYAPGYIGTTAAYSQGGYETSPRASGVAASVENLLLPAIRELLGK